MFTLMFAALAIAEENIPTPATPPSSVPMLEAKNFGIGLSLGTPTGFGCKLYLDNRNRVLTRSGYAVQAVIGGDLGSIGDFAFSTDAIYQTKPLNNVDDGYRLPIYYGLGLTGGINTQQNIMRGGLRAVAGLVVAIDEMPFEFAIESGLSVMMIDTAVGNSLSHMMLGQLSFRHF